MQQIIVFWRDLPAQVIVKRGRERGKAMLAERFQHAIDRAAMRAGKGGSDEYLSDWRRETSQAASDLAPQQLAEQLAASLEQQYSQARLAQLVKSFGRAVEAPASSSQAAGGA